MSLAAQFQNLQKQTSNFLQEMLGARGVMVADPGESGDADFACYYSPVRETEQLAIFGIRSDFDFILRVPKTEMNFVPEIGRNVRLLGLGADGSDLVVRLVKPRVHPLGVDHVFECKSQW